MITPEERLEQIKALSRARSQKYYLNNQAKVAAARKASRDACTVAKKGCSEPDCNKCKEFYEDKEEASKEEDISKLILNREVTSTKLQDKIESDSSKKFYANNLKTLEGILDCKNFNTCLKNAKMVIFKIESAKQKKDPTKTYGTNSLKGFYQTILKLVGTIKIKISKNAYNAYNDRFEILNTTAHLESKERAATEEVMDWSVYQQKVKVFFGEGSKESIIVSLYELSGFRDNLQLEVIQKEVKETDKNYIIVPSNKTQNLKIILNKYKTSNAYGQDIIPIPKDLSKEIRKYLDVNDIKYNDYLFGKAKLTGFIKKFNDKMGLHVTINKLRQMRVSDVLNNNPTVEERVKLSKQMKHKPITGEKYIRKTKNIVV